ncbi:MAG: hypothetical protein ACYDER_20730 [Ktedonobacteraceae bacterium]
MSLMAPPNQQQPSRPPPVPERRTWLAHEWHHWMSMPPLTVALLFAPGALLFYIAPLLPIAAYALWMWASHSWAWRDRWTSVWIWARQGGWLVAFLLVVTVLDVAHAWLVPAFIATAQAFWRSHLPGDLSLSPLDLHALIARTLLLLPLAPALALCAEWLDPRTRVQPRRILTPADLVKPTPRETAAPSSSTVPGVPPTRATASPPPQAPKPRQPKQRRKRPPLQQTTIESVLAADTAQTAQPVPSTPATETHPPAAKSINWDDVAE